MGRRSDWLLAGVAWLQQYADPPCCWQLLARALTFPASPRATMSTVGAAMARAARPRKVVMVENCMLKVVGLIELIELRN